MTRERLRHGARATHPNRFDHKLVPVETPDDATEQPTRMLAESKHLMAVGVREGRTQHSAQGCQPLANRIVQQGDSEIVLGAGQQARLADCGALQSSRLVAILAASTIQPVDQHLGSQNPDVKVRFERLCVSQQWRVSSEEIVGTAANCEGDMAMVSCTSRRRQRGDPREQFRCHASTPGYMSALRGVATQVEAPSLIGTVVGLVEDLIRNAQLS